LSLAKTLADRRINSLQQYFQSLPYAMFSLLLLWIGALIRLFRSRGNLAPATTRCARRAAYRTNTGAIRFCEKLLQSLRESPNIRAAGGLLRFARPFIDSSHKEVKSQASEEYEPGENRGRENCPCVTCKESFQSGAEKPDLDN
jgi:hypothetical protein